MLPLLYGRLLCQRAAAEATGSGKTNASPKAGVGGAPEQLGRIRQGYQA
ncbi:hypothetical protein DDI_3008 [Dickeya dianthicola RNS04.9]|nr:hypothetical protein DDI_3008 [Dickeya dianthicola RNS04.9]